MMTLHPPYLIFLGGETNPAFAKTAFGLTQWAPEKCLAQYRFTHCTVELGLADATIAQAQRDGAKSLVLGCAPVGGGIQADWIPVLLEAINAGMDIISGFHTRLNDIPELVTAAQTHNVRLIDIRIPPDTIPIASGNKRSGKRLLTVGTDCAAGKKYAALAIIQTLKARGTPCDFRATGQTGIIIAGGGMPIDAVVSDFVAGAAEQISPGNHSDHWDVIEGQGSLFHPAYAGVSLGLLHGSQPDALVLCHDPSRSQINGFEGFAIPDINHCIALNKQLASLTNPAVQCVGICINSSSIASDQRETYFNQLREKTGLPCVDPLIDGVEPIVERLLSPQPHSQD